LKKSELIRQKIFTLPDLLRRVAQWRFLGKKISFTNGIFDILHQGHVFSLSQAADEGDHLIVGLNSDTSTKKL
jgi:D-glycero-beta-D-manno-heptose 1-phosphate adenylyltransferase